MGIGSDASECGEDGALALVFLRELLFVLFEEKPSLEHYFLDAHLEP